MWFLNNKFVSYAREIRLVQRACHHLCSVTKFEPKQFNVAKRLLNELETIRYQISKQTLVFEAATLTTKGTFLSLLPWTETYQKRNVLADSYQYFDNLVYQINLFDRCLEKNKQKLLSQNRIQTILSASSTKLDPSNNGHNLSRQIVIVNPAQDLRSNMLSVNKKLKIHNQDESKDLTSNHSIQTNTLNFNYQKKGAIFTPKNDGQIQSNSKPITEMNLSTHKSSNDQISFIQKIFFYHFWQISPKEDRQKSIHEWLGLPQKQF